jgi:hypothetical protein
LWLRIELKNLRIFKKVVRPPLQICHRCQWYRWQIVTSINDTGGKFAFNVNGSAPWTANFCKFSKHIRNDPIGILSG